MIKFDMPKNHATGLFIEADFQIDPQQFSDALGDYAEVFGRGRTYFTNLYSRRKLGHLALMYFTPEDKGKYHLDIVYRVNRGDAPAPPREVQTLNFAIDALGPMLGSLDFDVTANFSYHLEHFTSNVRIPITLASHSESDFDEIRGFRLVKLGQNSDVKYSIIIDNPVEDFVTHSLLFTYAGKLADDTIRDIFRFAVETSNRFIHLEREKS